jgi:2,3-bisphosphoglycerate-independent phosphoglycerate mutase
MQPTGTPLVLAILDGFGVAAGSPGNAIAQAHTPTIDALVREFPNTTLDASVMYSES